MLQSRINDNLMKTMLMTYSQVLILVLVICSPSVFGQTGEEVYQNYCAGCHGPKMEGSSATALVKANWKHGGDRNSIMKSIRDGIPGTEMAKWGGVLSEKEIQAVTDYIVKAQQNAGKRNPTASGTQPTVEKPVVLDTRHYKLKVETVIAKGLNGPWGIEFIDNKRALITGKTGELYWIVDGKLDPKKIAGLPKTYASDLVGGMMDLALDPEYSMNGWVYIAHSYSTATNPDKTSPGMTRIVRGKVKDHQWVDEQVLFQVHDSLQVTGGTRWGSRLLFDKEGFLYFTIGDMNRADDSQILWRPAGKVYRIKKDGSIPADNPLYGKEPFLQAIYTWGNRNTQGLAQHPVTGLIYSSDHGPRGGDELNILKKGANYGWPVITYGIDYDGTIITTETHKEGMEQPITYWTPSIAVCATEFVNSTRFPLWQNNLLVTALAFQELRRLVIDGDKVTEQELLMKGHGRVRDAKIGPDGALYVLTNAPDALLRITPQN
jgi:glucose/arabinose dehydrogenase